MSRACNAYTNIVRLCLFTLVLLTPSKGQSQTAEYQVKGAFLYNFAQFADWPPQAFTGTDSPFVIGVLGTDPFGKFLDELLRGETIKGRPVILKRFSRVDEIQAVHILFIHHKFDISASEISSLSTDKNILTIGDAPGFAENGGIICFYTENNKVRFEVNVGAAKAAGLVLSSKLLRLAKICCNTP